jgi:hypothetical protein
VWLADFEDATAPTWHNVVAGQLNLMDALDRRIDFTADSGKEYRLGEELPTIVVRPRAGTFQNCTFSSIAFPCRGVLSTLGCTSSTALVGSWSTAADRTSTLPSWKAIVRLGSGTTCSVGHRIGWAFRAAPSVPLC